MSKNKIWLGIILSIILLIFSISGFTDYYKYTQESGANFYVGAGDKADALEDTNEMRQIIDDLGALLVHSKRDNLYPKDGMTGGTLQIPEAGLKFGNAPENDDIAAYIAGEMTWQTKVELGLDLSLYYLKTAINTLSKVETIYSKDIIDSDELSALNFTDLADTPANYTDQAGKYIKVNAGETALEFGTGGGGAGTYLELTDTPATYDNGKYAKSTADGVVWDIPAGGGTVTTSGTPEVNDIARFTGATVIEGLTYDELTTVLALTSDDLSDVDSIAMLNEAETVTGLWSLRDYLQINRETDSTAGILGIYLNRKRDGDPTYNVSSGDHIGRIEFSGWYDSYCLAAARLRAIVDGTPGTDDMPGRLEFLTTPDDSATLVLRMAIDNAGNIKMGDGAWTNYINVTVGGAMTAEGTSSIEATDLVIANQAAGDILYFNGINWIRLAKGTAGQVLTMNAGGTAPEWQTP